MLDILLGKVPDEDFCLFFFNWIAWISSELVNSFSSEITEEINRNIYRLIAR